jgi:hypothetical protein
VIREAAVSAVPSMIAAMDRTIDAQELAVAKKAHLAFLAPGDRQGAACQESRQS